MPEKFSTPEALVSIAQKVRDKAYCPYSKFRVGASLVAESGEIFTGCNVENASYPVTVCAERSAICKAVSEGYTSFKAIAIITDKPTPSKPCGMCRQALREFGKAMTIYCAGADLKYKTVKLDEILPYSFGPEDLNQSDNASDLSTQQK